jgi:hypothetical protein
LLAIPGIGHQDVAVIQSLLRGAGFFHRVHHGMGEFNWDRILIREADLPAIKEFLSDYRIRNDRGESFPIPW